MAVICPTITAFDGVQYLQQVEQIKSFATRVHIDLMDGVFAPTVSPSVNEAWWPESFLVDIHVMYQRPMDYVNELINLDPQLVVIHLEAEVDHAEFADKLRQNGVKAGLAILHDTPVELALGMIGYFDHALVFSGNLGHHGGSHADLGLLDKVHKLKTQKPSLEIGWDGGVNAENIRQLADGGVDVLNVGGFIQGSEDPVVAYNLLLNELES